MGSVSTVARVNPLKRPRSSCIGLVTTAVTFWTRGEPLPEMLMEFLLEKKARMFFAKVREIGVCLQRERDLVKRECENCVPEISPLGSCLLAIPVRDWLSQYPRWGFPVARTWVPQLRANQLLIGLGVTAQHPTIGRMCPGNPGETMGGGRSSGLETPCGAGRTGLPQ